MKSKIHFLNIMRILSFSAFLMAVNSLSAQLSYRITLGTGALSSSSAAPFYLDFQLFDGAGTGNNTTSAYLTSFSFGGGSAAGTPTGFGSFSGSANSGIRLTDASFFSEFYQEFVPGNFLSFDVTFTSVYDSSAVPDSFAFAILDSTLSNLPTQSGGSDIFAFFEIREGQIYSTQSFASDITIAPVGGGSPIGIGAPSIQAVPEPSTYGLLAAGSLTLAAMYSRRRHSKSK
ncbi:MAG: NF038129 family PEP-CTERM protein [Nibricoccus sp.]